MPLWRTSISPFPTPDSVGIHMSPSHPMHCSDLLAASVLSQFQDTSGDLAPLGWGQNEEKRAESPIQRCVVKVSGIHRRIRLIDGDHVGTSDSLEADLLSTLPEALHMDVCTLDLGQITSFAHSRRSLEDIHSEERGGFSRWQRPEAELQSKTEFHVCVGSGIEERQMQAETLLQVVDVAVSDTFAKMRANGMGNSESIHDMAVAFKHDSLSLSASIASPSPPYHVAAQHVSSFSNRCLTPQAIRRESASTNLPSGKMSEMQQSVDHVLSHSSNEGCKEEEGIIRAPMNDHESSTRHAVGDDHRVLGDVDHSPIQPAANIIISPIILPNGTPTIEETSLIEFLRAKKQNKDHFLDKIVARADVYDNHPWHFASAANATANAAVGGCLYFCCTTQYTTRGNVTRNRMTKDGGRWKQQGIVQPILTTREPARKTYLSYIARGRSDSSSYLVPSMAGRVKHRHRMVEIALEEDLESEKIHIKRKLTPLPFLVVCILRMST